jgi:hypothetical protein
VVQAIALLLGVLAHAEDLNAVMFKKDFKEEYWGKYTLNPSATCESLRGVASVKIDMVPNDGRSAVRVIYYDKTEKVLGTKLYPVSRARIMSLQSEAARPNSLLWESDSTEKSSNVDEKKYERMTFNEKVVSFDVLKTRDPQGFLSFFRPREVTDKTRCNFTKTDAMFEQRDPAIRRARTEKRRSLQ